MARITKEDLISPNPDINENREAAIEMMQQYSKEAYAATKQDKDWFWQDMDIECETEVAWEYINHNFEVLCNQYPFQVTEWFGEFYRYMPECLYYKWDRVGQIDWNLFFSLAYPLPGNLGIPFHLMINKLNVAQLRLVKEKIKKEVYDNPELRKNIIRGDTVPSIYTYYIPYQTLRKAVIELARKGLNEDRRKAKKDISCPHAWNNFVKEATKLINQGKSPEEVLQILSH